MTLETGSRNSLSKTAEIMKGNMNHSSHSVARGENQTDTTKLASLLALAAGAVALPQSSHADIIYTDRTSSPVTVGYSGVDQFLFTLPGTANFGFARAQDSFTTTLGGLTVNYRVVIAGDLGGGAAGGIGRDANFYAVPMPFGATWSQVGVGLAVNVAAGIARDIGGNTPTTGYDNQYLAWVFQDDSIGGVSRYGWVEVSLSMANYPTGPNVTIWGYAYDDTGAKPTMGQLNVPEPSSGALLVMGAMALGARGLRKWRQTRLPVNPA